MSLEDLRAKYGKGRRDECVRRAVRGEITAGNDVMDALELLNRIERKLSEQTPLLAGHAGESLRHLKVIRDAMIDWVHKRYDLGPTESCK